MTDAIWDPCHGLVGQEPWRDPHPSLSPSMTGSYPWSGTIGRSIAYLRVVLAVRCGRTALMPACSPQSSTYSAAVASAVHDLRVFFGLPAGYDCSEAPLGPNEESVWDVVDYVWLYG